VPALDPPPPVDASAIKPYCVGASRTTCAATRSSEEMQSSRPPREAPPTDHRKNGALRKLERGRESPRDSWLLMSDPAQVCLFELAGIGA
jgi:hypothetical protein